MNRHYIRSELRNSAFDAASQMQRDFPETTISYLDAGFPFINGFPLFPHLSHNDGKKLDLSFCYLDKQSAKPVNKAPSFIGYGICEGPLPGEDNTALNCAEKGHWQYSLLEHIMPQGSKNDFTFDPVRTAALVNIFATDTRIKKIFIEPHLKSRLKLHSPKVRFYGCQAVRHDDHIHIQL